MVAQVLVSLVRAFSLVRALASAFLYRLSLSFRLAMHWFCASSNPGMFAKVKCFGVSWCPKSDRLG
jgi:hypothetical protein